MNEIREGYQQVCIGHEKTDTYRIAAERINRITKTRLIHAGLKEGISASEIGEQLGISEQDVLRIVTLISNSLKCLKPLSLKSSASRP